MPKKSVKFPNVAYKYPKKVLMFWSQDPEWEMTPRVMESIRTLLNPRSPTAHLNLANHLNYAYCAPHCSFRTLHIIESTFGLLKKKFPEELIVF